MTFMGTDQTRKLSSFGIAAVAFDQELQRFQQLTNIAKRTDLDSRKDLAKAARAVEEATESHKRLGERMGALAAELQEIRTCNETTVAELNARKTEIASRMHEVDSFLERVNLLGKAAAEISRAVKRIASSRPEGTDAGAITQLASLIAQMDTLLEQSGLLARSAHDAKMAEIGNEIGAIRQQIQTARNKMNLLRERLEPLVVRRPAR